jgi:nanoRNase/pAp phosphatase (c-di-AMP/oligoRNAs hydrolase)
MDYEAALAKAKELVGAAKDIVVITHKDPNMDSMGGALALMLGLVSLQKKSTVICPDPVTVGLSSFVGIDKVVKEFGRKNFVVSLDYEDGSIEKVSYNIEGKKFNLVVEHRPGFEPFSADKVQYSYQGVSADLIITVDTVHLGAMGAIYENNKDMFAGKPVINIDFHNENTNYGTVNLVDPGASSSSELVAEFLATLGVKLTTDIATNLLNAIYAATNNFQNGNVTSMAFEVASVCLKAGAKRFGVSAPVAAPAPVAPIASAPAPAPQTAEPMTPHIFIGGQPAVPVKPTIETKPQAAPAPVAPAVPSQPPSDWLKPKIFKSSNPGHLS